MRKSVHYAMIVISNWRCGSETSQDGYSFCGDLSISIDNSEKFPMCWIKLRDRSRAPNNHYVCGIVDYWTFNGTKIRHIRIPEKGVNNYTKKGVNTKEGNY